MTRGCGTFCLRIWSSTIWHNIKGLKRTSCSLVHIRKPGSPKSPCSPSSAESALSGPTEPYEGLGCRFLRLVDAVLCSRTRPLLSFEVHGTTGGELALNAVTGGQQAQASGACIALGQADLTRAWRREAQAVDTA